MRTLTFASFLVLAMARPVFAAEVVDQEQLVADPERPLAIGGGSEQELAQTFTVGVTGFLTQVRLPVACSSGELVMEIRTVRSDGAPSSTVLAMVRVPAASLPGPPGAFQTVSVRPELAVSAGEVLAIVLRGTTDTRCSILAGPVEDLYSGGAFFFDSRPNPPGWVGTKDRPAPLGTSADLPFQTVVDDGGVGSARSRCVAWTANGPLPLPISRDVPFCRCAEDPAANEFRCRMLHPDFLLVRRIPLPPFDAERLVESWVFTPLAPLENAVKLRIPLAKGNVYARELGLESKPGMVEQFELERSTEDALYPALIELGYPIKSQNLSLPAEFGFDARYEPN